MTRILPDPWNNIAFDEAKKMLLKLSICARRVCFVSSLCWRGRAKEQPENPPGPTTGAADPKGSPLFSGPVFTKNEFLYFISFFHLFSDL